MKGASEIVLGLCTKVLTRRGPIPITQEILATLTKKIEEYGQKTLRTIALAYRDFHGDAYNTPEDVILFPLLIRVVNRARLDPNRNNRNS